MAKFLAPVRAALLGLPAASPADADWAMNMPVALTHISVEIYGLRIMVIGVCAVIGVITFGTMIYASQS